MADLRCPICEKLFAKESSPALPFCCERCRQIDLGRWLGEVYSTPVVRDPEDEEGEKDEG